MNKLSVLLGTLAATALVFALTGARSNRNPSSFGLDDLRGRYAFYLTGDATAGPVVGPFVAVGVIEADGNGNFPFATRTLNVAGQLIVQGDQATGTYTVNPDGTGSATFHPASGGPDETFDFTLIDRKQFLATATSPGVVGFGQATRQ